MYCQNWIPRVHKIISEKKVKRTIYQFLFFRLWANNIRMFGEILWLVYQNCLQEVQREILKEKRISKKISWISDFKLRICKFLTKKNRMGHQNCFVRIQMIFSCKIVEKNKFIFDHFPIFSKKISDFCRKMLERLSNIPSTCPPNILREQKLEVKSHWNRFRTLETNFWSFAQNFSTDPSELSYTYPNDEFQGKLFKKNFVSSFFFGFQAKMIGFTVEHFREDCQNSILRVQKFFWRNLISKIIIDFFFRGLRAKTFRTFSEKFLAGMHNCLLRVGEEIFERTWFSSKEEFFSHQFLTLSWWFSGFWQKKNSEGSSKLHSPYPGYHFGKKVSLEKINTFCLSTEKSRIFGRVLYHGCQNFPLRLRKKIFWGNRILRKQIIHFVFRSWEWMFQFFAQKFRAESSKVHFTYPVDQFEETSFLKSFLSSFLPDFMQEVSDSFVKSLSSRNIKQAFYDPKRIFW